MLLYLTIYYTSKINKIKTGVVHKNITFRLFKKYTFDAYKDALKKLNFTNYKLFNDILTILKFARPTGSKRIVKKDLMWKFWKKNTRNKLFKRFKKSRLHIDKELYKIIIINK